MKQIINALAKVLRKIKGVKVYKNCPDVKLCDLIIQIDKKYDEFLEEEEQRREINKEVSEELNKFLDEQGVTKED